MSEVAEKVRVVKSPVVPIAVEEERVGPQISEHIQQVVVYSVQLPDGRWVTRPSDY